MFNLLLLSLGGGATGIRNKTLLQYFQALLWLRH
jgi:hypothetical protein